MNKSDQTLPEFAMGNVRVSGQLILIALTL
jgi:hypothetical protein